MTYTRRLMTRALRVYWILLLLVGEIGLFQYRIGSCKWPTTNTSSTQPTTVAIVADPQIVDHYSYDQTGLVLRVTEFFTDIYVRKAYRFLQTLRRPQHIVMLGDLMDGGREWNDKQWEQEYRRYQSIFNLRDPRNTRVHSMAGNHDIGIGNTVVRGALARFHARVGPTNVLLEDLGGHDLVLLDTLTLENDDPEVSHASRQLIQQLNTTLPPERPRLLFSHVPLRRAAQTYCGPERQSAKKYLPDRQGYQFRDQLLQNTTDVLLNGIRPRAVFSGDDHDSCTVEHRINATAAQGASVATEYTVGAFGWASGVPVASYALLTLYPASRGVSEPEFRVQRCFLPYQLGIYKVYAASFFATLIIVATVCYTGSHAWHPAAAYGAGGYGQLIHDSADMSLPLPLPANMPQGRWSFSKRTCLLQMAYILRDLFAVGLPTYIACLLFYYIF
ncbi:hypothetical protein LPJ73_001955 [Coemansia sp. RSA 2703]|nr:hypothetical protein LPJ73_001955 [Coemansia sp. RSA 2703]KAJ2396802.1 hypothetical protein GGI05_000957 [Coemansia sp. RSA 2603]